MEKSEKLNELKVSDKTLELLTKNEQRISKSCYENLDETELDEYKEYLLKEGNIEEEYFDMVEEVYQQIGDGIYDIISFLDGDKKIWNWIRYGYEVDFNKQ